MVLGNTQARGLRTYGCIQDADAQHLKVLTPLPATPKNWVTTGDPARGVHHDSVSTADAAVILMRSMSVQLA